MNSTRLLWTARETALALGLSTWTIRRYIKKGILMPVRLNGRIFIEPSEVYRLIEENRGLTKYDSATRNATNAGSDQCEITP